MPVLNTIHPAYSQLLKVWPFKEGTGTPVELISGAPVTLESGSIVWTLESTGWGLTMDVGDSLGIGVDVFTTAPDITILYRRRKTDTTNRQAGHFGTADDSNATHRCSGVLPTDSAILLFDFGGGTNNISRLQVSGETFDTAIDTYVIRVNASEIRMWRKGTDIGHTTGGAPPTRVNTGVKGTLNKGIFTTGDKQFLDLFAIYTGSLSDAICANLSLAPNDIFVGGMSGSTSLTVTATASLRTGAAFTGATGLSITATSNLTPPALLAATEVTVTAAADLQTMPFPRVLTLLCPVSGRDQFTTGRLVAMVEVEARTGPVQPVLTVLVPVGLSQASSGFTMTVLVLGRDGDGAPTTDARSRRILVPVGLDEVA